MPNWLTPYVCLELFFFVLCVAFAAISTDPFGWTMAAICTVQILYLEISDHLEDDE